MSFKSSITLKYDSEWTYPGSECLPEEHFTMEFPADDLSSTQLFTAYRKFLLAAGYNDTSIAIGAASLAFNDSLPEEQMRKTAQDYELILSEDHYKKVNELEDRIQELEGKIMNLKAHLSRAKNPENPNYTDDEIDAMYAVAEKKQINASTLKKAYQVCSECGNKYGEHKGVCSSWWIGNCDVCGKESGVTEARDFKYLKKGIEDLSK